MAKIAEPDDFESLIEAMALETKSSEKTGINPERWQRVRNGAVLFSDIVSELTGKHGSMISCPFHGRDSTPSFALYPPSQGNCGYCFGCSKTYDAFKFVQEYLGISARKALLWIEKTFDLPFLEDIDLEDEDEITIQLEFEDLEEPYIKYAAKDIQTQKNRDLAEEYLQIFFEAERERDALPLARVIGREGLAKISQKKVS